MTQYLKIKHPVVVCIFMGTLKFVSDMSDGFNVTYDSAFAPHFYESIETLLSLVRKRWYMDYYQNNRFLFVRQ